MCESDHPAGAPLPAAPAVPAPAARGGCGDKHRHHDDEHGAEAAGDRKCRNCPDCVRRNQAAGPGLSIAAAIPA